MEAEVRDPNRFRFEVCSEFTQTEGFAHRLSRWKWGEGI